MGNSKSALRKEEVEEAMAITKGAFSSDEVCKLYEHFSKISGIGKDDGVIDVHEFAQALGMAGTALDYFVRRVFEVIDVNGDGYINFMEFLSGLATLDHKASDRDKLYFSFRMYDRDGDSRISQAELTDMLKDAVETFPIKFNAAQLETIVGRTFEEAAKANPGYITFEEYASLKVVHPMMLQSMSLKIREQIENALVNEKQSKKRRKSGNSAAMPRGSIELGGSKELSK